MRIPLVLGPTASGKSALALYWAEQIGAEIVSADSRQIYRYLDIGTAKPSPSERARVQHHFIDELDPDEPFTAARFAEQAEARIGDLLANGRFPIVVGGSTLYLQALVHGFSPVPDIPAAVRQELMDAMERVGLAPLVEELQQSDPLLAARTDLTNPHRVMRALEVFRHTGQPLSSFQGKRRPPRYPYDVIYLLPERKSLYARIEARVDEMARDGLVQEVAGVLARGYGADLQPLRSIGYAEIIRHLEGDTSLEEALQLVKTNTRRYAKRQMTFFNKYFADALRVDPARTAPDDAAISRIFGNG